MEINEKQTFRKEVVKAIGELYSFRVFNEQDLANHFNLTIKQISLILQCYGYSNGRLVEGKVFYNYNKVAFIDYALEKFTFEKKYRELRSYAFDIHKNKL